MTKNYKLIKKYPSLPQDWEIEMEVGLCDTFRSTCFSPCSRKYKDFHLPYVEVTNNPEFWEEVVEKDYEILSFVRVGSMNYDGTIFSLQNGLYSSGIMENNLSLEHCLKGGFKIHSIKRLADGEVFTVDDLVKRPHYRESFKINHIHISGDIVWLHSRPFVEGTCTHSLDKNVILNKAIKQKQPLFTTEDGVEIFEGGEYFEANLTYGVKAWTTEYPVYINKNISRTIFSTKEAAEEYILMNKPCLSLNDIFKIYPQKKKTCIITNTHHANDLINLVKQKIN